MWATVTDQWVSISLGWVGQKVGWEPPPRWFTSLHASCDCLCCWEASKLCQEEERLWVCRRWTYLLINPSPLHTQACSHTHTHTHTQSLPGKADKCSLCSHCSEHYFENSNRDTEDRGDFIAALRIVKSSVISTFWHLSKYGPPCNALTDRLTWV